MVKKILIICANFIYTFFKILPVKNKVTMISRQSNKKTLDFELLEKKLKKDHPEIQICILCRKLEGGANARLFNKIQYMFHCSRQMYHIATSKVVLLDSYCILISILKQRKGLKVIQMWHSMGTMKKFGYQILGLEEGTNEKLAKDMKMHKNYDYVFASSEVYAPYLAEGFGCSVEKIRIYSLPRVDLLNDENYKEEVYHKIKKTYPQISQKKNIVYCPTFRKNEKEMKKEIEKMINRIDYKQYNLIIKLHPLSKITINNDQVINDKIFSSFDMLFIADYIISDYSCIIYEAAVLKIPLYFWAFDLEQYIKTRGLTIDYEKELPGIVSKNIENVIQEIEKNHYDKKKLEEFRKKYVRKIEHCTKDIVDFIVDIIYNKDRDKILTVREGNKYEKNKKYAKE